ncbi:vitellogenin receptor isoform X1 [Fopius arisanus]|uniref:Vitellogenin receptor isoform X1 n=1 Tax=Fopius arisanus TaxID=64838 RepID=A0A9R1TUY4_9HYME|nr:PREDICTED: vitellogenin receptor-like isoform X1 [Fopius arisanus]
MGGVVWLFIILLLRLFTGASANLQSSNELSECNSTQNEFRCSTGTCVPKIWVCDGERDCLDGGDEWNCDDEPKNESEDSILIYSSDTEIGAFDLITNKSLPLIMKNLRNVVGVALDETFVYWSMNSFQNEGIYRAFKNGTGAQVLAIAGIGNIQELAVDGITGNIYYTDASNKYLGVCTASGVYCTAIITEGTEKPRGLALYPPTGQLYWSDWGNDPHISRAEMNGNSRTPLVTTDIIWPNGIAIDDIYSRLYWADAKLKRIESINFLGEDRQVLVRAIQMHPFSLSVFQDRILWSDWETGNIRSCNKTSGESLGTLVGENRVFRGVHVYQAFTKFDNPCEEMRCGEICLIGADLSCSCACSANKTLEADGKTCKGDEEHRLILGAGGILFDYRHEFLGRPQWREIENPEEFASVFPESHSLSIRGWQFMFEEISIISGDNETLGAVAFDSIGKNFYSVNGHNRIQVTNLLNFETTFISFSEDPRSILLVPEEATMFVALCSESSCHVDRMSMSGGGRTRFVREVLGGPRVPLAFDPETRRVFWGDETAGTLNSISFDGYDKQLLQAGLKYPVGLAILKDFVFGTVKGSREVFWANKTGGHDGMKALNITETPEGDFLVLSLNFPRLKAGEEIHECRIDNGGCSHVCLLETTISRVCGCPLEMTLESDQKTCSPDQNQDTTN